LILSKKGFRFTLRKAQGDIGIISFCESILSLQIDKGCQHPARPVKH